MIDIKNKIYVNDNLVNSEFSKKTEDFLLGWKMPYYLPKENEEYSVSNKAYEEVIKKFKNNIVEGRQYCHHIVRKNESELASPLIYDEIATPIIKEIASFIKVDKINVDRIKINLQNPIFDSNKDKHNTPHTDDRKNHLAAIYYGNDSDGDTFFFEKDKIIKRVNPVTGRLVIFDGSIMHAGRHPINNSYRVVINFNFNL
tara:strand:+ start:417 stop:1016 length:600 start_codon:yes stop_codon:yes gene_type:complete